MPSFLLSCPHSTKQEKSLLCSLAADNCLCAELHEYTARLFQYIPVSYTLILSSHTVTSLHVLFFPTTDHYCIDILTDACHMFRYNVATGLEWYMQISSWDFDLENEGSAFRRNFGCNSPTDTASYAQEHDVIISHRGDYLFRLFLALPNTCLSLHLLNR